MVCNRHTRLGRLTGISTKMSWHFACRHKLSGCCVCTFHTQAIWLVCKSCCFLDATQVLFCSLLKLVFVEATCQSVLQIAARDENCFTILLCVFKSHFTELADNLVLLIGEFARIQLWCAFPLF